LWSLADVIREPYDRDEFKLEIAVPIEVRAAGEVGEVGHRYSEYVESVRCRSLLSLAFIEFVALVLEHQLEHRALRDLEMVVENQMTVSDCGADSHPAA
jgi:hypothetical protein